MRAKDSSGYFFFNRTNPNEFMEIQYILMDVITYNYTILIPNQKVISNIFT